jgi:hypothetical protein
LKENIIIYQSTDKGIHAFINHFSPVKSTGKPNQYTDESTKSTWDFDTGECISGDLKGKTLDEIAVTAAFWFAWSSFYPNTEIID